MRKGFSLAFTLWIVAALMTGALFFVENGKKNLKINASIIEKLELELNTDSYMNLLMFYLATGSDNHIGAIVKNNLQVPFLREVVPIDGTSFMMNDFNVSIQSVSGMINLAFPDISMIAKLFAPYAKGPEAVLQDSLQDWLDEDSFHRINGAEADYYASLGVLYEPRNKNIILSASIVSWGAVKDYTTLSSYVNTFQDFNKWLDNGWVDYVMPMIYKRESVKNQASDYLEWLKFYKSCSNKDKIIPAIGAYLNTSDGIQNQIEETEKTGYSSWILFDFNDNETRLNILKVLGKKEVI